MDGGKKANKAHLLGNETPDRFCSILPFTQESCIVICCYVCCFLAENEEQEGGEEAEQYIPRRVKEVM